MMMSSAATLALATCLLLAPAASAASSAAATAPPVPDDCVPSPYQTGLELSCSLSAINSADERTNFAVIPAQHTLSLVVRCREHATLSKLEPDGFRSLGQLRKLTLEGCQLHDLPARAFAGLHGLRSLTLRSPGSKELRVDSDAFLGLAELEELNLGGNRIRHLPPNALCPLRKLRALNLADNEVEDLAHLGGSLECLHNLRSADFSGNRLASADASERVLSAWGRLEDLRMARNRIKAVKGNLLRGKSSLRFFDASNNELTTLPAELFADCVALGRVDLANNTISFLPTRLFLGAAASLATLDLSGNQLASLDSELLSSLEALTSLDLSRNGLAEIEGQSFRGLRSLQSLRLSDNKLSRVPISPMPALKSLVLSRNQLARLPARIFTKLPALSHVLLDDNQIEELPRKIFSNSSSLTVLDLSGNRLRAVPEAVNALTSLQSLAVSHNFIDSLTELRLGALWRLQAAGNKLRNVSARQLVGLPALQVLDLSRNRISSIEKNAFSRNPPLQAVRLDDNRLRRLDGLFHTLPNLSWLNVSANEIAVFDYAMLPATLQWLDLHHNNISALENFFSVEAKMDKLAYIDASFNQIVELGPQAFPDRVETLLLNDNKISSLVPYTFFKKTALKKVDLSVNRLEFIDRNALRLAAQRGGNGDDDDEHRFGAPDLRPRFFLGGNPIKCDCHMAWFKSVNSRDDSSLHSYPLVADLESIYCQLMFSRERSVVPLVDARTDDFLCTYKTHCFALCHCCDYDACDCEMTCPGNCTCYHDTTWTKNIAECSSADFKDLPDQLPMDATEIFLDGNDVGDLHSHTFIGRKNLMVLYLNHSLIASVENHTFNGLSALEELHLEGNQLAELQGDEFHGLAALRELYLQDNRIRAVNNATFRDLGALEVLLLQGNRLVDFAPWNLAVNPVLSHVQLAANRWSCECRFRWQFRRWLQGSGSKVVDSDAVQCWVGAEPTAAMLRAADDCAEPSPTQLQAGDKVSSGLHVRDGGDDGASGAAGDGSSSSVTLQELLPALIASVAVVVVIVVVLFLVFFVYRDEMRIWLYSKYGVRFFHRIDGGGSDLGLISDTDKVFDAFVAYSAKDDAFVRQLLAPELEMPPATMLNSHHHNYTLPHSGSTSSSSSSSHNSSPPHLSSVYKLCLFYRDLSPHLQANPYGQVSDTIVQAAEASRRSVLVLSENFVQQEWARYDYKSGLHQALRSSGGVGGKKGGAKRLIVVLLGDIAQRRDLLDPDLRLYLKAGTVLQWGDKLFWDKLRYALPDVPSSHHQHQQPPPGKQHPQHHMLVSTSASASASAGFSPDTNSFRYESYPTRPPPQPQQLRTLQHSQSAYAHAQQPQPQQAATMARSVGGDSSVYQSIGTPDEQDSTRTMTIHI